MKAQKINEDSKRHQTGKAQKGTGEKPTSSTDDLKTQVALGKWYEVPLFRF